MRACVCGRVPAADEALHHAEASGLDPAAAATIAANVNPVLPNPAELLLRARVAAESSSNADIINKLKHGLGTEVIKCVLPRPLPFKRFPQSLQPDEPHA